MCSGGDPCKEEVSGRGKVGFVGVLEGVFGMGRYGRRWKCEKKDSLGLWTGCGGKGRDRRRWKCGRKGSMGLCEACAGRGGMEGAGSVKRRIRYGCGRRV